MAQVFNPLSGQFDIINKQASKINIADVGDYYTGTQVEAALQEIGDGTTLDGRYVNVTGDTMTGQLEMKDARLLIDTTSSSETQPLRFAPNGYAGFNLYQRGTVLELGQSSGTSSRMFTFGRTSASGYMYAHGSSAEFYPLSPGSARLGRLTNRWLGYFNTTDTQSLKTAIETITTTDTLDATNHTVLVNASSGAVTVNLPTAIGNTGLIYNIKVIDFTNAVTVDANGTETIDGEETFSFEANYESITIQSSGTGWYII